MTDVTDSPPAFPMTRLTPFDPPPGYAAVRDAGGLARVRLWDGRTAWLVTGYEQVRSLLGDPRISVDRSRAGFPFPTPGREALERSGATTFVGLDPPDHTRLRRVFTKYFAVKRIETLRPVVQRIVDDLVTGILEDGPPADFVTALAGEVPSRTICHVLGMPLADRARFQALDHERNTLTTSPENVIRATNEMLAYADELITRKQREPADDLISRLVADQLGGDTISRDELVAAVRLLITAGHETTTNMIGLGIATLLRHPAQLRELRADPALVPAAVEELLRYISIFHISPTRVVVEPIDIAGQRLEAGDGVIAAVAGANRDDAAFPDAATFDVHREARHHVAFGYGVHQCLGQPLARVELQTVVETLFRRIPSLRFAGDPDALEIKEYAFLSLAALPLTWEVKP
ncbi:cytochrome P450 [Jiangella alkaliphila]|uniref:Pentalenic acid synthase n=1 Tax=Jiangella alkaliphila TaxID=419479 RepID=A0A1H2JT99_9ACTN|nr:cytochrome P450 [Jiangella alkaliphila]SDU59376.1 pentalenic acid synthase [Jiangella alkaliphila]